jgi:hypothetical protein
MVEIMNMTDPFLLPKNAAHRQYEALRAFFVDKKPQKETAVQFGYSLNTFRVMCSNFRKNPDRNFFVETVKGPAKKADKEENMRCRIIELRKRNLSIYDIADHLKADGRALTPQAIGTVLKEEGFSKLPRRRGEERPLQKGVERAAVANASKLDLSPRRFHTKFGGLFLLLPVLAKLPLPKMLDGAGFPGTRMIPNEHAVRSILALKMFGNARHTHVMSDVFDEGLALFAGLNVIPKASFLAQYSSRVAPECTPSFLNTWFDAIAELGYAHGNSFDLDFHTIPTYGDDELIEKHYLSKRSRRQKGILSFVANDTENRAFCYVNANLRRNTMNDEILKFVEFWKEKSGSYPDELVFDSTFTTYENMDKLNKLGINFITLRRRGAKVMDKINATPNSAWRRITLENIARAYRTPKILEEKISLKDYDGQMRQLAVRDLGHEHPTIIVTNQMHRSPAKVIQRYARRMIIENNIADAVDFFHMDALSSTVALKVNLDLLATVMASTVYRLFAERIGYGYENAKFSRIFRDFISATANVEITSDDIIVKFQKRANNPKLFDAGFQDECVPISWLEGRRLRFDFS